MSIDESIEKYALANAVKFNGKANPGSVISHVIGEHPDAKSNMKEVGKLIAETVARINKMMLTEQMSLLKKNYPEMLEEKPKEKKEDLKELEGVDEKVGVIMRFAPSPSGPMHLGHAITGGLTSLYVKKYGGKFILRIEDTNSDNIDSFSYEQIPLDGQWIFGNVTDVWIQSDRMKIYYDYLERFFERDAIYVCTCSPEQFKEYVSSMTDCPCRNLSKDETKVRWQKMFDKENGFKEGDCVIRFKSNMQDKNPAMRDFPLARINDSEHPRQGLKYRVWPLMNLCVAVDDIEADMTHIIRAKDHTDNAKRQAMMFKALELDFDPKTYFLGRYNFEDLELSCSKTKVRIKAGEFSGWDDIRLPFLMALKRRGYRPEAFMKYTQSVGLSPVDKSVKAEEFFKVIESYNKDILDPISDRFFFIKHPVEVKIHGAPEQNIELSRHPHLRKGGRQFKTHEDFYMAKEDFDALENGELYRFMDCLNFTKKNNEFHFDSLDHEVYKAKGKRIMHFLPKTNDLTAVEVMMPDKTVVTGLGESRMEQLNVGDVIQAERFGFMRLDSKRSLGRLTFWYTHN